MQRIAMALDAHACESASIPVASVWWPTPRGANARHAFTKVRQNAEVSVTTRSHRSVRIQLEDPIARGHAMYKPLVSSAPAHSILNAKAFDYTSSVETDIRKTFARVRRERAKKNAAINATHNVRPLIKKEAEMLPPGRTEPAAGRSRFVHAPATTCANSRAVEVQP